MTDLTLNRPTFHIPEPGSFNKTVLRNLDSILATLDGKFTASESATPQQIDIIQADAVLTTSDCLTYVELTLGLVNGLSFTITLYLFQTMAHSRLAIDAAVGNREFRKSVEVQLHCEFYKRSMLTE